MTGKPAASILIVSKQRKTACPLSRWSARMKRTKQRSKAQRYRPAEKQKQLPHPALHPDGRASDPPAAGVDSTPSPRTDRRTAGRAAAALGGNTEGTAQSCAEGAPDHHQGCGQNGTGDAGSVYGGGHRKNSDQRGGHRPGGRVRVLRRKSHRLRTAVIPTARA